MPFEEGTLYWTETLTGLERARIEAAHEQIDRWGFEHLSRALLAEDIDAAVAATLLVEGVATIAAHGVAMERLLKKLRMDRDLWGTWAEFRAADILLRGMPHGTEVRLEEGRSKGVHADFRVLPPGEGALSVEVKAIGLSDEEVAFCTRMAPAIRRLVPKVGLAHGHASIQGAPPRMSSEQRRAGQRESKRRIRDVPMYPKGLRGSVIVGHGSEESYALRVSRKVEGAVRQLPEHDECFVAIFWSNGAPIALLADTIRWGEIPEHVTGLIVVGCGVAFPDRQIHCFTTVIDRESARSEARKVDTLQEEYEGLAGLILDRFERSSGVRPVELYGGQRLILRRDGSRRIIPFNLLLDADPPQYGRGAVGPAWAS